MNISAFLETKKAKDQWIRCRLLTTGNGLVQKATILAIDAGGSAVSDIAEFFGFCMPTEPGCVILPVFGKPCASSPACGTAAPPNPQTVML